MPRKKSKNDVLVGFLGIVVSAVVGGAQKNPAAPPSPLLPGAAPVCSLAADPTTVGKGQDVTLSWTSQNATDIDLQPGVGKVHAQGSIRVKPDDSTTYTMTVTGPGGSMTCTLRVSVVVPTGLPPPLSPSIGSLAWSPDGSRLAMGSNDGNVRVWDAETGKELLWLVRGHASQVWCVAWSPDGERLAGSSDGTAKVWNAKTGEKLLRLDLVGPDPYKFHPIPGSRVWSVAWSPDGRRLATGTMGPAKVWDAETGKELAALGSHSDSIAWSPDGKRLATGSPLMVWDAETGKELLNLGGVDVHSLAWSPDGKRLAMGSACNTTKVYDAETGKELLSLDGLPPGDCGAANPRRS